MSSHESAPMPKRQKSSARSSVRSVRIEKPLSSQVSANHYSLRRRTTPAMAQRQPFTNRHSGNVTSSLPMAPPSCVFPFQSFEYKRPSTWHYNSGQISGNIEVSSASLNNQSLPPQNTFAPVNTSITGHMPIQWPSEAFSMRSKSNQSAPPSSQLLFNEIPQATTWFNTNPFQAEDNLVISEPTSFYFDSNPNDVSASQSLGSSFSAQAIGAVPHEPQQSTDFQQQLVQHSSKSLQAPAQSHLFDLNASSSSSQQIPAFSANVEQDLVGLGLYDKPTPPATDMINHQPLFSEVFASSNAGDKHLKLAETWQPPSEQASLQTLAEQHLDIPEQVPDAEEDDGADSPEDEVEAPQIAPLYFSQQPLLTQEPEKMGLTGDLGGQTFLFDDDTSFDASGTSWFQDTSCISQLPFDATHFGGWNGGYGNKW